MTDGTALSANNHEALRMVARNGNVARVSDLLKRYQTCGDDLLKEALAAESHRTLRLAVCHGHVGIVRTLLRCYEAYDPGFLKEALAALDHSSLRLAAFNCNEVVCKELLIYYKVLGMMQVAEQHLRDYFTNALDDVKRGWDEEVSRVQINMNCLSAMQLAIIRVANSWNAVGRDEKCAALKTCFNNFINAASSQTLHEFAKVAGKRRTSFFGSCCTEDDEAVSPAGIVFMVALSDETKDYYGITDNSLQTEWAVASSVSNPLGRRLG